MNVPEGRPAVFFDRDGSLMRDVGYVGRAERVELLPDAAAAVRRVNEAQWLAIVVTNQSGIARGLFTESAYAEVHARLVALMSAHGARIDGEYHCPHHPDFSGPCDCRKPLTALFERAIVDFNIDAGRSACIGDRWRDIEPSFRIGGRGILVPTESTPEEDIVRARASREVAAGILEAVNRVLNDDP